jgi:hypothetical protein
MNEEVRQIDYREQVEKHHTVTDEASYLFDSINEINEIKTLNCFITPGAYDDYLSVSVRHS